MHLAKYCSHRSRLIPSVAGGGLSAAGYSIGTSIVIAGLALQLAVFLCFLVLAAWFHIRIRKVPTTKSLDPSMLWQRHMLAIFVASCLIFTRSAIRLAEYAEGFTGYLYTHEWCLYLLDFVPMMLVVMLFVWIHPSEINAMLKGGRAMRGLKTVLTMPAPIVDCAL